MDQEQTADHELARAAKGGSAAAFEQILLRYERPIFGYACRIVGNREDAADVAQETFLKAYRRIHRLESDEKIKPWLYTIATRTAYDWLRKHARKSEPLSLDDPHVPPETIEPDPSSQEIEQLANAHDLARALDAVKPVYRTALLLYYREGFRYEEIATMLDVPLNTVKTYLYRGRAELKRHLA